MVLNNQSSGAILGFNILVMAINVVDCMTGFHNQNLVSFVYLLVLQAALLD